MDRSSQLRFAAEWFHPFGELAHGSIQLFEVLFSICRVLKALEVRIRLSEAFHGLRIESTAAGIMGIPVVVSRE